MALTLAEFQKQYANAQNDRTKLTLLVYVLRDAKELKPEDFDSIYNAAVEIKTNRSSDLVADLYNLFPQNLMGVHVQEMGSEFPGVVAYAIAEILSQQGPNLAAREWYEKSLEHNFVIAGGKLIKSFVAYGEYAMAREYIAKLKDHPEYKKYEPFLSPTQENMEKGITLLEEEQRAPFNPMSIRKVIEIIARYLPEAKNIIEKLEAFEKEYGHKEDFASDEEYETALGQFDEIYNEIMTLYLSTSERNPHAAKVLSVLKANGVSTGFYNDLGLLQPSFAWSFLYLEKAKTVDSNYQKDYHAFLNNCSLQEVQNLFIVLALELKNTDEVAAFKKDFIKAAEESGDLGRAMAIRMGMYETSGNPDVFVSHANKSSSASAQYRINYRLYALTLVVNLLRHEFPNNFRGLIVFLPQIELFLKSYLKFLKKDLEGNEKFSTEHLDQMVLKLKEVKEAYASYNNKPGKDPVRTEIYECIQDCLDVIRKHQPLLDKATTAPEPQMPLVDTMAALAENVKAPADTITVSAAPVDTINAQEYVTTEELELQEAELPPAALQETRSQNKSSFLSWILPGTSSTKSISVELGPVAKATTAHIPTTNTSPAP